MDVAKLAVHALAVVGGGGAGADGGAGAAQQGATGRPGVSWSSGVTCFLLTRRHARAHQRRR